MATTSTPVANKPTQQCSTGFIVMPNVSDNYLRFLEILQKYETVHVYVCVAICILGVLMNVLIVFVLTKKNMRSPINILLTFIALCDTVVMCSYLIFMSHFHIEASRRCNPSDFAYAWAAFALTHSHVAVIGHTSSLWISVAMAQIRHTTLVWAEKGANRMISESQAILVSLAIIALITVAQTPTFLTYSVVPYKLHETPSGCKALPEFHSYARNYTDDVFMVVPDMSQNNCLIVQLSFWANGLVFKLIPCLLLTVFIGLLLRFLETLRRRRMHLRTGSAVDPAQRPTRDRTTSMLIILLAVFLITEIPQGILAFLSGIFTKNFRLVVYNKFGNILDLFSLINSASNFVILCTMSKQFRKAFLEMFFRKQLYQPVAKNGREDKVGLNAAGHQSMAPLQDAQPNHADDQL